MKNTISSIAHISPKYNHILYKLARILGVCCLALLLAATVSFACHKTVSSEQYSFYYQEQLSGIADTYDYILVPGAGIVGFEPGTYLRDRLDTAAALYTAGKAPKIIISGALGEGELISEPDVMYLYLTKHGVPGEDILLDQCGHSTYDTLYRANAYRTLTDQADCRFLICTQALYAPRTMYLANRLQLSGDAALSDIHIYTEHVLKGKIREYFAATKAVATGILLPSTPVSLADEPYEKGGSDYAPRIQ